MNTCCLCRVLKRICNTHYIQNISLTQIVQRVTHYILITLCLLNKMEQQTTPSTEASSAGTNTLEAKFHELFLYLTARHPEDFQRFLEFIASTPEDFGKYFGKKIGRGYRQWKKQNTLDFLFRTHSFQGPRPHSDVVRHYGLREGKPQVPQVPFEINTTEYRKNKEEVYGVDFGEDPDPKEVVDYVLAKLKYENKDFIATAAKGHVDEDLRVSITVYGYYDSMIVRADES